MLWLFPPASFFDTETPKAPNSLILSLLVLYEIRGIPLALVPSHLEFEQSTTSAMFSSGLVNATSFSPRRDAPIVVPVMKTSRFGPYHRLCVSISGFADEKAIVRTSRVSLKAIFDSFNFNRLVSIGAAYRLFDPVLYANCPQPRYNGPNLLSFVFVNRLTEAPVMFCELTD